MLVMTTDSKILCAAPWTHLSVEPNGAVFTCCMATSSKALGLIKSNKEGQLQELWNGELMKSIRLEMMKGRAPHQCRPCYELEEDGSFSQRVFINERFKRVLPQLIEETHQDGKLNAQPQYLGLRFSNICNFACRICDGQLSTGWYKDEERLGREHPDGPLKVFENIETLENFFAPLWPHLSWVYFAGGEPFLSVEHHSFLHLLRRNQRLDVDLLYNTNLSTLKSFGEDLLELWDGFHSVTLNVSLDAIYARAEYLRYGQNWQETEDLLKLLRNHQDRINVTFTPVISIHNIFHLKDYLFYFFDNFSVRPDQFVLDPLKSPSHSSINVLPQGAKEKAKSVLKLLQKELLSHFDLNDCGILVKQIAGLMTFMEAEDCSSLWPNFCDDIQKVDEIREQDFLDVFPEFKEYFIERDQA